MTITRADGTVEVRPALNPAGLAKALRQKKADRPLEQWSRPAAEEPDTG